MMATMNYMYNPSNNYLSTSPAAKPASLHDSARGSPEPLEDLEAPNGFDDLVDSINEILGPCNGIDSEGVDIGELKFIMRDYRSVESEWQKYAFADYSRGYTRNLVDKGNGKANLVSHVIHYVSICHVNSSDHCKPTRSKLD